MQTRIVFAIALVAALVWSAAHAEDWLSLPKTSDDRPTEIFIDLSSMSVLACLDRRSGHSTENVGEGISRGMIR
jgi:hypothetical protein